MMTQRNRIQKQKDGRLQVSRRGFITSACRAAALAALGGLGAVLVFKRIRLEQEGMCPDPSGLAPCGGCRAYANCLLPRAVSTRKGEQK